ncbi:MAG TPA: BON domain-containing protein [Chitinophagaceae bacterium]
MSETPQHIEEGNNEDLRIKKEILLALQEHPRIDESKILVEVLDAEVVLKGNADTEEEKQHAQIIAAAIHGVKHVENRLHVDIGLAHVLSTIAAQMSGDAEKDKPAQDDDARPQQ